MGKPSLFTISGQPYLFIISGLFAISEWVTFTKSKFQDCPSHFGDSGKWFSFIGWDEINEIMGRILIKYQAAKITVDWGRCYLQMENSVSCLSNCHLFTIATWHCSGYQYIESYILAKTFGTSSMCFHSHTRL